MVGDVLVLVYRSARFPWLCHALVTPVAGGQTYGPGRLTERGALHAVLRQHAAAQHQRQVHNE